MHKSFNFAYELRLLAHVIVESMHDQNKLPDCMENMTTSPRNVTRQILSVNIGLAFLKKRHYMFVTWLDYGRF